MGWHKQGRMSNIISRGLRVLIDSLAAMEGHQAQICAGRRRGLRVLQEKRRKHGIE